MKLSDAIRLGAMLKPQAFGAYQTDRGSCALGAAGEAAGVCLDDNEATYPKEAILREWPWLATEVTRPVAHEAVPSLACVAEMIPCLNDFARWTREQIADWVASIEPAEDQRSRSLVRPRAVDPVDRIVESADGASESSSADSDFAPIVAGRPPRGDR